MIYAFYSPLPGSGKDTAADALGLALKFRQYNEIVFKQRQQPSKHSCKMFIIERFAKELGKVDFDVEVWNFKNKIHKTSFSKKIHEMTACLLNQPIEEVLRRSSKDKQIIQHLGCDVRQVMIGIGEGLRASISPNIWVNTVTEFIESYPDNNGHHFLIAGMRHPNEYEALERLSDKVCFIKITSNFAPEANNGPEGLLKNHLFDYEVENQFNNINHLIEKMVDIAYALEDHLL